MLLAEDFGSRCIGTAALIGPRLLCCLFGTFRCGLALLLGALLCGDAVRFRLLRCQSGLLGLLLKLEALSFGLCFCVTDSLFGGTLRSGSLINQFLFAAGGCVSLGLGALLSFAASSLFSFTGDLRIPIALCLCFGFGAQSDQFGLFGFVP
ncbi:hypothetical protein D3C73_1356240 [compost metagenome]